MEALKVLVVDDSTLFRKLLTDILSEIPDVLVVGASPNGEAALDFISKNPVDLVTLDVEMPVLDGLGTLRKLKKLSKPVKTLMVSSLTKRGADITMEALEEGAFDFVAKPEGMDFAESKRRLSAQLRPLISASLLHARLAQVRSMAVPVQRPSPPPAISQPSPQQPVQQRPPPAAPAHAGRREVVAIGISTGGPNALAQLLPRLPKSLSVPILIVQHMPPIFTASLADSLAKKSQIKVVEAADGDFLEKGKAYIAPGGAQMQIVREGTSVRIRITDAAPENNCKPSADYLFRSVAEIYRGAAVGVIMTGMGADGVKGLKVMRQAGARIIGQDKDTCVVYGMPMEAAKAGVLDVVSPLDKIADEIIRSVG